MNPDNDKKSYPVTVDETPYYFKTPKKGDINAFLYIDKDCNTLAKDNSGHQRMIKIKDYYGTEKYMFESLPLDILNKINESIQLTESIIGIVNSLLTNVFKTNIDEKQKADKLTTVLNKLFDEYTSKTNLEKITFDAFKEPHYDKVIMCRMINKIRLSVYLENSGIASMKGYDNTPTINIPSGKYKVEFRLNGQDEKIYNIKRYINLDKVFNKIYDYCTYEEKKEKNKSFNDITNTVSESNIEIVKNPIIQKWEDKIKNIVKNVPEPEYLENDWRIKSLKKLIATYYGLSDDEKNNLSDNEQLLASQLKEKYIQIRNKKPIEYFIQNYDTYAKGKMTLGDLINYMKNLK